MKDSGLVTSFRESKKRGRRKEDFKIEKRILNNTVGPNTLFRPLEVADEWSPQIDFSTN